MEWQASDSQKNVNGLKKQKYNPDKDNITILHMHDHFNVPETMQLCNDVNPGGISLMF